MEISANHLFLNRAQQIREICRPLLLLDIDHFSFTRNYPCGQRIYLSTHPNLLESYFWHKHYLIGSCESKPSIYLPQKAIWSTLPEKEMYLDAKQKGILDGIFITNPQKNFTEFSNFGTTKKHINIANVYLSNFEQLNQFILYFKEKATLIINESKKIKFYLPHHKKNILFINQIADNFPSHSSSQNHNLSKQQYACATRLLKGATFKEIAAELKLSPRTVETYVESLKNKLNVNNRAELILRLSKLNIEQIYQEK